MEFDFGDEINLQKTPISTSKTIITTSSIPTFNQTIQSQIIGLQGTPAPITKTSPTTPAIQTLNQTIQSQVINLQEISTPATKIATTPQSPLVNQTINAQLINTLQQTTPTQNTPTQDKEISDINDRIRSLRHEIAKLEDKYDRATYYDESQIGGEIASAYREIKRLEEKKTAILARKN